MISKTYPMRLKGFPQRHPAPSVLFDSQFAQLQDLRQICKSQSGPVIARLEYFHNKFHDLFFPDGHGKIILVYWYDVYIMGEDVFKLSNLNESDLREALFVFEEPNHFFEDNDLYHAIDKPTIDKKLNWYRKSLLDLFDIDLKPVIYTF